MKTLTLPEILHLLRTTKLPQCKVYLGDNGACCGMGVIARELGFPQKALEAHNSDEYDEAWSAVSNLLHSYNINTIRFFQKNDSGHTFPELATWIEQQLGLPTEPLL